VEYVEKVKEREIVHFDMKGVLEKGKIERKFALCVFLKKSLCFQKT